MNAEPIAPRKQWIPPQDWFARLRPLVSPWAAVLALTTVALLSVLHFYELGFGSLHPWDECLYALRAKVILFRGQWLDQMPYCFGPHYSASIKGNGFYSGSFPPLLIWLMALSMKAFGITSFAARLPSAFFGMGCVWLMFLWARRTWDLGTAVWTAFTLASWFVFVKYARRAQFDVPVVFFMILTGYCGLRYYMGDGFRWLVFAGVALGLGLMTKIIICGFVAVSLFLFAGALWLRGEIRFRRWFRDQVVLNAIGLGIAEPWHLYMIWKYQEPDGNAFLSFFWGYHISKRAAEPLEIHDHPWHFYYGLTLEHMGVLWSALIAIGILSALWIVAFWFVRGVRRRLAEGAADRPRVGEPGFEWTEGHSLLLPLVWFCFVYGLSQATASKRIVYLFPFAPPMALLTARLLTRAWSGRMALWARWGLIGLIVLFGIVYRSKGPTRRAQAWLEEIQEPWLTRLWGVTVNLWPIVVGALAIVVALYVVSRLFPAARRLGMFLALGMCVFVGTHNGLRHSFDRKSMREYSWDVPEDMVRRGGFDRIVYVGPGGQPDLYYYTDAARLGLREDVRFKQIQRPVKDRPPLPADEGTLALVAKYKEGAEGLRSALRPREVKRFMKNYELIEEDEDFQAYRVKGWSDGETKDTD